MFIFYLNILHKYKLNFKKIKIIATYVERKFNYYVINYLFTIKRYKLKCIVFLAFLMILKQVYNAFKHKSYLGQNF